MDFYIKKGASLPILKVEMCLDGRSDYHLNSYINSELPVYLSLIDELNGTILFASKECFVTSEFSSFENKMLYYINYQFTRKETNEIGKFTTQFSISSDNGVVLLPLKEKIYVNIIDSFSVNDFVTDICSLKSIHSFIFPSINSEGLNNLNLYQLCLDYKSYRDMVYFIKSNMK